MERNDDHHSGGGFKRNYSNNFGNRSSNNGGAPNANSNYRNWNKSSNWVQNRKTEEEKKRTESIKLDQLKIFQSTVDKLHAILCEWTLNIQQIVLNKWERKKTSEQNFKWTVKSYSKWIN